MIDSGRNRLPWEKTAMNLAYDIASYRSEDPFVQVGAVIIKNDNSILVGYNGAPKKMELDWTDRDARRVRVFHAEANVLNLVIPGEVRLMAVTHLPCIDCLKIIKQKEISLVYYGESIEKYNPTLVYSVAAEFGIELKQLGYTEFR